MLKEAIDSLFQKGVDNQKAASCRPVPGYVGHGRTLLLENGDNQTVTHELPIEPRNHRVDTVECLIAAANRYGFGGVGGVSFWIGRDRVVLVANDATDEPATNESSDRRDRVTLPLHTSGLFEFVTKLGNGTKIDQPTLIRALRTHLAKASGATSLLSAVRKIKWRSTESGYSHLTGGNSSLGSDVEHQVAGVDTVAFEERITVSVAPFTNLGEQENVGDVTITVDPIAAEQKFFLEPLPDSVSSLYNVALASIAERIGQALPEAAIFYGSP